MNITYAIEPELSSEEFVSVLQRSTLGLRRPIDEAATIDRMLRGASIIITARRQAPGGDSPGELLGVARAITDYAYCTYLSDLAVDTAVQRGGIGKALIERTHQAAGLQTRLILLSAPAAEKYYPHIGLERHDSCWMVPPHPTPRQAPDPPPVSAEASSVGEFFDQIADEYDSAILRCFPRYPEMLAMLLEYTPKTREPRKILELGSGTGNLSSRLARKFPAAELHLVDLSRDSLSVCQRRIADPQRCVVYHQDMSQLSFGENEFDLIYSSIALHHLTTDQKQGLLDQCRRWLTDGGAVVLADQFAGQTDQLTAKNQQLWNTLSRRAGASELEWSAWMKHQAEHDHHERLSDFLPMLQQAGFAKTDVVWRYLLWSIVYASS